MDAHIEFLARGGRSDTTEALRSTRCADFRSSWTSLRRRRRAKKPVNPYQRNSGMDHRPALFDHLRRSGAE